MEQKLGKSATKLQNNFIIIHSHQAIRCFVPTYQGKFWHKLQYIIIIKMYIVIKGDTFVRK